MHIVTVYVHVKADRLPAFVAATLANACATREEPGNLRFDVLQQTDDPTQFTLLEVYRDESGMAAHKETKHYANWRDTVAEMMAEPRRGVRQAALFPVEATAWESRP